MAYCASPGWLWWWRNLWNDWEGKPKYSEKTCPRAALSTTNPTCCPDANQSRRGGKPATNRLSYGTASCTYSFTMYIFPLRRRNTVNCILSEFTYCNIWHIGEHRKTDRIFMMRYGRIGGDDTDVKGWPCVEELLRLGWACLLSEWLGETSRNSVQQEWCGNKH
jgi:hypothetical protein